jgi:tryptophan synthase alpha chain
MSRIDETFERLRQAGQKGLVTYFTAGDPHLERSRDIIKALADGGADVIEVGVPFSDPIADGPVIQRASERALAAGGCLDATLELIGDVRKEVETPIVLFTYVNPVLRMGASSFVRRASDAGIDGVLVLDLPVEGSVAMHRDLEASGIDQIFLISPTTTDRRLQIATTLGRGFLYAISRLGVTGTRDAIEATAKALVDRIRQMTDLPVAVGFGISQPSHVRDVTSFADAAVVGSALVELIADADTDGKDVAREVEGFVRSLRNHCSNHRVEC